MPVERMFAVFVVTLVEIALCLGATELDAIGISFLRGTITFRTFPEALQIDQFAQGSFPLKRSTCSVRMRMPAAIPIYDIQRSR